MKVCINLFKSKLDSLVYIIQSRMQWILGEKLGVPIFALENREVCAILMQKLAQIYGSCKHLYFGGLFPKNNIHGIPKKLLI